MQSLSLRGRIGRAACRGGRHQAVFKPARPGAPAPRPAPWRADPAPRQTLCRATDDGEGPETAREALDAGLQLSGAGQWAEALLLFEKSMYLPGTGVKRYRDKPRAISDSEKMTALYNIACCHARLGDVRSGLLALSGSLELGYADFAQIRRDPDIELLRKDERFEPLLQRYDKKPTGLFGGLFGGFK